MVLTNAQRQAAWRSRQRAAAGVPDSRGLFVRAALAHVLAAPQYRSIDEIISERWPTEHRLINDFITKTVSTPATLGGSGWADSLAQTATALDFFGNLAGQSAGASLLQQCPSFVFNRNAGIKVPSITTAAGRTSFVAEGSPIPVRELSFGSITLAPKRFSTLIPFTRAVRELSSPNLELMAQIVLADAVAADLDTAMFSNTAGDAVRPAGLLVGLSALTPSSATPAHTEALPADIGALVAAVAPVALNERIIFVASPKQAAVLKLYFGNPSIYQVLASSVLSDKTVLCFAHNALVSALDSQITFDAASDGAIHMDTAPVALATGTGPVVATPIRSLYQTDTVVLKMTFNMSWALRSTSGLSFMTAVNW